VTLSKSLIKRLNFKMATMDRVITRTQGGRKALGEYQLLDTVTGQTTYLSLGDVKKLARDLGLLRSS
jgi:hypothetical protein